MVRPPDSLIAEHREVQGAAKSVLAGLAFKISASDTEASIAATAYRELCALGFAETWYYTCPAFVLAGSRSCMSISGRDYIPNSEAIGPFNLVTVDLSPVRNGHWGDCARSFYIEGGRVVAEPAALELAVGRRFLQSLHTEMQAVVNPEMKFHELFEWANDRIRNGGFENLDFLGNVGHSIVTRREDRLYIQAQNFRRLKEVSFFTFEPHVRCAGEGGDSNTRTSSISIKLGALNNFSAGPVCRSQRHLPRQ